MNIQHNRQLQHISERNSQCFDSKRAEQTISEICYHILDTHEKGNRSTNIVLESFMVLSLVRHRLMNYGFKCEIQFSTERCAPVGLIISW